MSDAKHAMGEIRLGGVRRPITGEGVSYHTVDLLTDDDRVVLVIHADGAGSEQRAREFAARVTLAVNGHDDLLAACQAALDGPAYDLVQEGDSDLYEQLSAAIAKANGA